MTIDRLADECHGYDLEGYPVELSIFAVSPRIAAKLARCEEIARAQRPITPHTPVDVWTDEDRDILYAVARRLMLTVRPFSMGRNEVRRAWFDSLNA